MNSAPVLQFIRAVVFRARCHCWCFVWPVQDNRCSSAFADIHPSVIIYSKDCNSFGRIVLASTLSGTSSKHWPRVPCAFLATKVLREAVCKLTPLKAHLHCHTHLALYLCASSHSSDFSSLFNFMHADEKVLEH